MDDEVKYIKTLDEKALKSFTIAKNHLGSSFELRKSIGFIKWKQQEQIIVSSISISK